MKPSDLQSKTIGAKRTCALDPIDYAEPEIKFIPDRAKAKRVLDRGCVMHTQRPNTAHTFSNAQFTKSLLKASASISIKTQ